ncbi:MAG: hypothetical protein ACYDA8_14570 [Deferrisomatales bacterium]
MNRWAKCAGLAVGLVGPGTVAAAEGAARQDTSGVFVWAFLGLCALIVVAQLVPAILMAVGAARGVAQGLRSAKGREVEAR